MGPSRPAAADLHSWMGTNYGGALKIVLWDVSAVECRFRGNEGFRGGAVDISDSEPSTVTFVASVFAENDGFAGGAIAVNEQQVLAVESCVFEGNRAFQGGAIQGYLANLWLKNCRLVGNTATWQGGGLFLEKAEKGIIENCVLTDNRAEIGAAVSEFQNAIEIRHCTIARNTADSAGGGIYGGLAESPRLHTNNIIWNNIPDQIGGLSDSLSVRYSDVMGGWPGTGNIDADPAFVSRRGFDYLLGPGSPCIDAGDPEVSDGVSDWHPRWPAGYPNAERSDMGAYGGPGNRGWARTPH